MPKSVLSVGQCVPDESSLEHFLEGLFDVEFEQAATKPDAITSMQNNKFDLVLINRKLDADYTDGLEIIQDMQKDDDLKMIPVMLISNYRESQEEAVSCGALYGFGKLEFSNSGTKERLTKVLG